MADRVRNSSSSPLANATVGAGLVHEQEPIATHRDGTPLLFGALGLTLHLEPPSLDDEEALEEATGLLHDWVGEALRWTSTSSFPELDPYREGDLDFIAMFPSLLATASSAEPGTGDTQDVLAGLRATSRDDYAIDCHGADFKRDASPYQVRFFATLGRVTANEEVPCAAVLRVTVPESWPLADFRMRATTLASALRVRWGSAGYTYAGFERDAYHEVRRAVFAAARRFPGTDIPEDEALLGAFANQLRSVNWLTFVGPSLLALLEERGGAIRKLPDIRRSQVGENMLLEAGDRPQKGDQNRGKVPAAYTSVDQMLRPIMAQELHFGAPWSADSTTQWLHRLRG